MTVHKRVKKTQNSRNLFRLARHELVKPAKPAPAECVGWTLCEKKNGQQGWVPQAYLSKREEGFIITMDFVCAELSVDAGQTVSVLFENLGRTLCQLTSGVQGWIHTDLLE